MESCQLEFFLNPNKLLESFDTFSENTHLSHFQYGFPMEYGRMNQCQNFCEDEETGAASGSVWDGGWVPAEVVRKFMSRNRNNDRFSMAGSSSAVET